MTSSLIAAPESALETWFVSRTIKLMLRSSHPSGLLPSLLLNMLKTPSVPGGCVWQGVTVPALYILKTREKPGNGLRPTERWCLRKHQVGSHRWASSDVCLRRGAGAGAVTPGSQRTEMGGLLWMRFKALEEWMDGGWGTPEVNRKYGAPEKRGWRGGDPALHS